MKTEKLVQRKRITSWKNSLIRDVARFKRIKRNKQETIIIIIINKEQHHNYNITGKMELKQLCYSSSLKLSQIVILFMFLFIYRVNIRALIIIIIMWYILITCYLIFYYRKHTILINFVIFIFKVIIYLLFSYFIAIIFVN